MHVVGVYVLQRSAGARAAAVSFLLEGHVGSEKNSLFSRWYRMEAFQICDPPRLSALEVVLKNKCFPFSRQLQQPEMYKDGICVCVCLWSGLSGRLPLTFVSWVLISATVWNKGSVKIFGNEDHWLIIGKWLDSQAFTNDPMVGSAHQWALVLLLACLKVMRRGLYSDLLVSR